MVKNQGVIIDTLKNYVSALEKNKIRIQQAVLFGSYARGNADQWSDIDVALVSDDFIGDRFSDRKKIARVTLDVDYNISPITFRPEDFTRKNFFVEEILETGIRIR